MNPETFLALFQMFEDEQIEYVLVGPIASAVCGRADGAEQIDVFVESEPFNMLRLHRALHSFAPQANVEVVSFSSTTFRWLPPNTPLLFVFHGRLLAPIAIEVFVVENVPIRVAPAESRDPVTRIQPRNEYDISQRMRAVFNLTARLVGPRQRRRGVRKYRSWSAALADRVQTASEHEARVRAERLRK